MATLTTSIRRAEHGEKSPRNCNSWFHDRQGKYLTRQELGIRTLPIVPDRRQDCETSYNATNRFNALLW